MNDAKKTEGLPRRRTTAPAATKLAPVELAGAMPKQARSRKTRQGLIQAAREIFARDGFDHARVEDIAAATGKTRGAFYDHFTSKEDIFFAIFEADVVLAKRELRKRLREGMTAGERREVLVDHLLDLLEDRNTRILLMEFKLYALRHPERQGRLADLHAEMCYEAADHLDGLVPELILESKSRRRALSLTFGAVLDGWALNRLFDPGVVGREAARPLVRAMLDVALGPL